MTLNLRVYENSTELANLNGKSIYMNDMIDATMRGRLNTFLQGDTGSGKTQLVRDVSSYFGDESLFILGRNDMDTRELFQQVNPEFVKALRSGDVGGMKFKELSEKINYHFIGVDELPNCVPAVRAQLFNLFDGFIEIDGKPYPIGAEYSIGIATGNIGQKFTESSNELGRALKDRMHMIIDTDYFMPQPKDTYNILSKNRNPRVEFGNSSKTRIKQIIKKHEDLKNMEVPIEKYLMAGYLIHGLDYLENGRSKIQMKSGWPNKLEEHETGSDAALILPVSIRAAKSIITLSQALDQITKEKKAKEMDYFSSMMIAFKFASAYSGILNEAMVRENYDESHYKAMDAVIETTKTQFDAKKGLIAAGIEMVNKGKKSKKLLDEFNDRWYFVKDLLPMLAGKNK